VLTAALVLVGMYSRAADRGSSEASRECAPATKLGGTAATVDVLCKASDEG